MWAGLNLNYLPTNLHQSLIERDILLKRDEHRFKCSLRYNVILRQVAVTEKTKACEELLEDITSKRVVAVEKKELASAKALEIEEQNKAGICI